MAASGEWTLKMLNMNRNPGSQSCVTCTRHRRSLKRISTISEYVAQYLAIAESAELISSNAA